MITENRPSSPRRKDWSGLIARLRAGDLRKAVAVDFAISLPRLCLLAQQHGFSHGEMMQMRATQREAKS